MRVAGLKSLLRGSKLILPLCLLLTLQGCGYSLNHRIKDVFVNSKGIFVPVFANSTDEMGVEMIFTNALIRELGLHGELVLNSKRESGLELKGTIEQISYVPTAYYPPAADHVANLLQSYSQIPDEIAVNISISMQLIDSTTHKVLWSKRSVSSRKVNTVLDRTGDKQAASSFGILTQSLIDSRYSDIATDVMRDLYDDMVELF